MMELDAKRLECEAMKASALLKAMSNPNRLELLCHMVPGERSVGQLIAATGLGQSAASQHLAVLRGQGLVETRREKQVIFYSLRGREARAILETLYGLFCSEKAEREELPEAA